jgi:hypothetical protein
MSEPDNFLSRWSRRKREAERDGKPEAGRGDASRPGEHADAVRPRESGDPVADRQTAEPTALDSRPGGADRGTDHHAAGAVPGEADRNPPGFDLSTLPPIESITSATDIRAFLQKGVPAELTRAALRRAWTADPAIRDFIGIAENQYDFATGSDIPGFGSLDVPAEEVRKLVAQVFGELPKTSPDTEAATENRQRNEPPPPAAHPGEDSQQDDVAAANQVKEAAAGSAPADPESIVQREKAHTASQQNIAGQQYDPPPPRRSHGRAIPQ